MRFVRNRGRSLPRGRCTGEGKAGRHVFDDGRYVDLGRLKGNRGNRGNQNYPLPADVDWSAYTSVSIWCDRFDVSFGAARIERV